MLSFVEAEGTVGTPVVEGWYRAHHDGLVRLATLASGDVTVAEDAVQDVFASMVARPPTLQRTDDPLPYLRASVLNRCRSGARRSSAGVRAGARFSAGAATTVEAPERDAMTAANRRVVLDAVRALPARQRDVILLRHYLELSEAEIANSLGVSVGTVKSSASRARRTLSRTLEGLR